MNTTGSYGFTGFHDPSGELARLMRQAEIASHLELPLIQAAGLRDGMRFADIGCGPGVLACHVAGALPGGQVTGIDYSEALLQTARALAVERGVSNCAFLQGNVYELDVPDGTFDFVYARFLFQHLQRPDAAMGETARILKPGGICLVADVDDQFLMLHPEPDQFAEFTRKAEEGQRANGGDRFVGRKLGACMKDAGLAEVRTQVQVITTHDLGLEAFLAITTGFKTEQIPENERTWARSALEGIVSQASTADAFGAVGVFLARGVK